MNNKNMVEISDNELENVSGGIDRRTKAFLLKGLTLGALALAITLEFHINENGGYLEVKDDSEDFFTEAFELIIENQ